MTINDLSRPLAGANEYNGSESFDITDETHEESPKTMPIAIVGMSCRFPGDATDPSKLWDLCESGGDAWSEIPASRFDGEAWYHPDKDHIGTVRVLALNPGIPVAESEASLTDNALSLVRQSFVKGGYFLSEDISKFDASFFNFPGETAATMDPEVRMQLECVYEALESAAMTMEEVAGSNTAVCAGTCFRDFHDSHLRDPTTLARFYLTGNGMAMISNRVSHFYNLKGPSIAVDTGCSTTLTLLHMACQSLRSGEADMAIVGGSNALINPDMFISGTILGLLSPEGKCFSFDSRASGYGRGEGAATLILKPLDAAVRDGNPIRAVIRETAANQDGKTPTLTSPSRDAQIELMKECYSRAGLDPRDTGYVECHGTGTQAGDTTEATAIGSVLGAHRARGDPLPIGSVKTNIGHTEASSGLAGVIKAVMAIEKKKIPPSINFEKPNPNIPFSDLGIKVSTACQAWPTSSKFRASVNNFGYGGSNAHVVIEHPDYLVPYYQAKLLSRPKRLDLATNVPGRLRILKVSAKDARSTASQMANVRDYVQRQCQTFDASEESVLLDKLVYTFGHKRSSFPWTIAIPISTAADLMTDAVKSAKPRRALSSQSPRIGYVFSGQGAQWYAMGRELITAYPVFHDALQEADGYLRGMGANWSLLEEMMRDEKASRIDHVIVSLPASVAIQLALVRLLESWGIKPAGVTGHSSGEVAAAFAAGAIDMKQALAIVYSRGSLTVAFQEAIDRRGAMLAAGLSREGAKPYIDSLTKGKVVVACVNSPSSVTISGDLPAIEELEAALVQAGVFARRLRVDAAYHSHHMLGFAEDYRDALAKVLCDPSPSLTDGVIYSSPVTGDVLSSAATIHSPAHWVKNMVQPVEFLDCLTNLCLKSSSNAADEQEQINVLLEVGPHAALQSPIRQVLGQPLLKGKQISYLSCLRRGHGAVDTMQAMASSLIEAGYHVDLETVNFPLGSRRQPVLTDLPSYPWNHETSYWVESRQNAALRRRKLPVHDLLGLPTLDSNPFARRWRHILRAAEMPWVRDHQIQTNTVYPGAGYISMAIEACRQAHGDSTGNEIPIARYDLRRVDIVKALIIPETTAGVEVHLCLQPCGNGILDARWHRFQVLSVDQNDNWSLHCEGQIMAVLAAVETSAEDACRPKQVAETDDSISMPASLSTGSSSLESKAAAVQDLYDSLRQMGLNHGPIFQNIVSVDKEVVSGGVSSSTCEFVIADSASTMPYNFQQDHVLHPTTLDSIFQAVYTALPAPAAGTGGKRHAAMLPRSIESLTVSAQIATRPATALAVRSGISKLTAQGFSSDAVVSLEGSSVPSLEMKGLFCQSLGDMAGGDVEAEQSQLCFTTVWKPDVSFLGAEDFLQLLSAATIVPHSSTDGDNIPNGALTNSELLSNGIISPNSLESALGVILEHLVHKNSRAQLLEIQGASGDLTETCLTALGKVLPDGETGLVRYTWTDPSSDSIEAARTRFAAHGNLLRFEEHPVEQSKDSYDLVLMPIEAVEKHCSLLHTLVRPGGLVLAVKRASSTEEKTATDVLCLGSAFQTLKWDVASAKLVLAIRFNNGQSVSYHTDVMVIHAGHAPSQNWLRSLGNTLFNAQDDKSTIECRSLAEVACNGALARDRTIVLLDNYEQPILVQPDKYQFEGIKAALTHAETVLWVSKGGAVECEQPDAGLGVGLLRTLRCEYPTKQYISLDLASDSPDSCSQTMEIDSIAKILATTLGSGHHIDPAKGGAVDLEMEYAVRDGLVHIPRVFEDKAENSLLADRSQSTEDTPFFTPDRKIRLGVRTPGLLDSLVFVEDDTVTGPLGTDQVEIRPAAFGLNFRDVMVGMGQLDESRMGFECSGIITAIGPEAAAARGLEVGDRVYAFLRGYFANNIRVHHTSVARVPEGMDMETAASIPLVFITAYHALYNMARLRKGETILIHSGTGGVGQAAIMLAQLAKAEVFVTVGTKEKREFVTSRYGIPDGHIFNSRDASFSQGIMKATQGRGVDVVLNSLAGPLLAATWSCIAPFGRFIEIGKRDLEQNSSLEMAPFVRSVMFASLDLITLGELRGDIVADVFVQINALLRAGCISAVAPVTSFSISDAGKAFRTMQAGRHMGKIILVPHENDVVKAVPKSRAVELSPSDTYLIVGGLGGIGRSIAAWMVDRGARNLVLLSRSADSLSQETLNWLQGLRNSKGAVVRVQKCDVGDRNQLALSLEAINATMPTVKGVIQAAMVLRDTLFDNMDHSEYGAAVDPKVRGSLNLHELLPADLDFFIMLSSVSGVGGNASQANYAAGSTFQDALARHRVSRGLAGVSLDLGMVKDIGVLADGTGKNKTAARLERIGLRALSEDEVLRLVESSIRRCGDQSSGVAGSQIITGIPALWSLPDHDGEILGSTAPFWVTDPRFSPLEVLPSSRGQGPNRQLNSSAASLAEVLGDPKVDHAEASAALSKALVSKLASMFMLPEMDIDDAAPLARLGVDSLISVELRNWITAVVRANCSVFDIMQAPSLAVLAGTLADKSSLRPSKAQQETSSEDATT